MIQEYDNKDIRDVINKSYNAGYICAVSNACSYLTGKVSDEFVGEFKKVILEGMV